MAEQFLLMDMVCSGEQSRTPNQGSAKIGTSTRSAASPHRPLVAGVSPAARPAHYRPSLVRSHPVNNRRGRFGHGYAHMVPVRDRGLVRAGRRGRVPIPRVVIVRARRDQRLPELPLRRCLHRRGLEFVTSGIAFRTKPYIWNSHWNQAWYDLLIPFESMGRLYPAQVGLWSVTAVFAGLALQLLTIPAEALSQHGIDIFGQPPSAFAEIPSCINWPLQ